MPVGLLKGDTFNDSGNLSFMPAPAIGARLVTFYRQSLADGRQRHTRAAQQANALDCLWLSWPCTEGLAPFFVRRILGRSGAALAIRLRRLWLLLLIYAGLLV